MKLDTAALDAIEAALQKATPGPWEHDYGSVSTLAGDDIVGIEEKGTGYSSHRCLVLSRANGDFIALANPSTVAALIAEVRESRRREGEREHWAAFERWARRPSMLDSSIEFTPPFEGETRWLATITAGTVFCCAHYGETREQALARVAKWCDEAEKARKEKRDAK